MNLFCKRFFYVWVLIMGFSLFENTALAQNIPKPVEGSWVVRDFKFSTGETLPELKLNYTTIEPNCCYPFPKGTKSIKKQLNRSGITDVE